MLPNDILTLELGKEKLTSDEVVILKNIDSKYKWIVRDEDKTLSLSIKKPCKTKDWWDVEGNQYNNISMFENIFKSVKWEDEEPQEISKLIDKDIIEECHRRG